MRTRADIECWLTDMDGVLVHENRPILGAAELLAQWRDTGTPFLVLTNNPIFTPRDLSARLARSGLDVPEDRIWTSALATAEFLRSQMPGGTAYVIGEAGLTTALHEAGYIMTETQPDYVVVGETRQYSFEAITKAIRFINAGARFIITNPDATGPTPYGVVPATGSFAALISPAWSRMPAHRRSIRAPSPPAAPAGARRGRSSCAPRRPRRRSSSPRAAPRSSRS